MATVLYTKVKVGGQYKSVVASKIKYGGVYVEPVAEFVKVGGVYISIPVTPPHIPTAFSNGFNGGFE